MRAPFSIIVAGLSLCALLAGCSSDSDVNEHQAVTTTHVLPPDKGAISGLLIDDVYRPVPGGLVLLQGTGLVATTDEQGQFTFLDLAPGSYIAIASAPKHEAAPQDVDVVAGQYSDLEIEARRLFSNDGSIITTFNAVFVPCSVSGVGATQSLDCTGDASGDSARSGFTSNFTGYKDATYLVTEMKANHKASTSQGAFKVVVREHLAVDPQGGGGDYWASKFTTEGDYLKIVMQVGNLSTDDTEGRNVAWNNDKQMETFLFPQGAFKSDTQGALDTACATTGAVGCDFESRGVGPQVGVKANFVQSLFLGPPARPIEEYQVMGPSP